MHTETAAAAEPTPDTPPFGQWGAADRHAVHVVLRDSIRCVIQGTVRHLRVGDAVGLPAGVCHAWLPGKGQPVLWSTSWAPGTLSVAPTLAVARRGRPYLQDPTTSLPDLLRALAHPGERFKATPLPLETDDPVFAHVLREVLEGYTGTMTQREMAASVGLTAPTFSRRFRAALGLTWPQLIGMLRTANLAHALATTDQPILEAAAVAGFSSTSSTNRTFRTWTGHSPTGWRRALQRRR